MYRNACQRGMLTIFFGGGTKPLSIWDTKVESGYISRFLDQEIKSMVLEIGGTNISTTYMICPKGKQTLGITMPFLVMIVRNLKKYFSFEVTILDDTGTRRRFRVSNFQSSTQIQPLCTAMPIALSDGWNQIQFNLSEFTKRAYKKSFLEVQKLKVNANIRIRRIYFAERLLPEEELPAEYKLYLPIRGKGKGKGKEPEAKEPSKTAVTTKIVSEPKLAPPTSKTSVHTAQKESEGAAIEQPPSKEEQPTSAEEQPSEPAEQKAEDVEPATEGETGEQAEATEATEAATEGGEQVEETVEDQGAATEAPAEATSEVPAEATAEAPPEAPAEEASAPGEAPPEAAPAAAEEPAPAAEAE